MPSRRATPSPTSSRPRINIAGIWSTSTTPTEEYSEPVWPTGDPEARRISDNIDQALRAEKAVKAAARRKQRKVLVLGQSESGKSTLVKQFRLMQSPEAFAIERESWKSIIYLNIVRSILKIIDTVAPNFNLKNPTDNGSQNFARLRLLLMPLRSVEASIVQSLSYPGDISRARSHHKYSSMSPRSNRRGNERGPSPRPEMDTEYDDVFVHPESPWQLILQTCMRTANTIRTSTSPPAECDAMAANTDDPAATLEACAADMKLLWSNPAIHQYLKEAGLFMEETSGFFLNDIERIASRGYTPTDDDILRSRVKTIAPTETVLPKLEQGLEWRLYDVGGARRQRAKWAPFFDDMDLLIVIVPVSAFDQYLAEDHSVNRLQDSFEMWIELCKATALHHIPVLLFLNKTDILEKKLNAGIRLCEYLVSYGDRPNELKKVLQYLTKRFSGLRKSSKAPSATPCYIRHTSVVDRSTTQTVIAYVRDQIVIGHMRQSYFV
ncbi:Guanine nucleotide-binding protein alpha-4 subunit [Ustilago maydis 521] [Rhizoctonia solani]|uniref:Guanine nucleotide-binding protein alpha-4 subunit [Ustilago maydis 521] n=1 Tax=Rhizoctonia solani TaxID=456999 RepID=A0A0K6FPQ0_9AGAM|nr:Guanine nucleotide-binding protein alpha-4 subunit [Ustilago maydis 521] [Rhizoctonia solani]